MPTLQQHLANLPHTMRAIGYTAARNDNSVGSLMELTLPTPTAEGFDVLVKVNAVSVNPVDYKIRQWLDASAEQPKVLGWDAVGVVVAVGESVSNLAVGERVYYAGDLTRSGSNSDFQLVDARLVAKAPNTLTDSQAAALPLTALTAWEMLFDHLQLSKADNEGNGRRPVLLVVGAAGGVGSILVQLALTLTNALVIATASRPESVAWLRSLGVQHVINHQQPMAEQITDVFAAIGNSQHADLEVTHIASLHGSEQYWSQYVELLAPFGHIALIDDPKQLDALPLKRKSLALHWTFMFTRSMFTHHDIGKQGEILSQLARLVDNGTIRSSIGEHFGDISVANLRRAHMALERGQTLGKIVLGER